MSFLTSAVQQWELLLAVAVAGLLIGLHGHPIHWRRR